MNNFNQTVQKMLVEHRNEILLMFSLGFTNPNQYNWAIVSSKYTSRSICYTNILMTCIFLFVNFGNCLSNSLTESNPASCLLNVQLGNETLCSSPNVALTPIITGAATCPSPICSTTILSYSSTCDDPSDCLLPTYISSCLTSVTGVCPTNTLYPNASCNGNIVRIVSMYNDWDFSMIAQNSFVFQTLNANFLYTTDGTANGNLSTCPTTYNTNVLFYLNGTLQSFKSINIIENQLLATTISPNAPFIVPTGSTLRIIIDGQPISQDCDLFELAGLWVNGCCTPTILTPVENNTFLWAGPGVAGITDPTAIATAPGTYCVTVTDCEGCQIVECSDVTLCNSPPSTQSDINNTLADVPVNGNVLTNDVDPDADNLIVNTNPVTSPINGTLVLNIDGIYFYTPNAGFSGIDFFVYEVNDGNGGVSTASVIIAVNDISFSENSPTANYDFTTTPIDSSIIISILENDYDSDGESLSGPVLLSTPPNGTLVINQDQTITYTPDSGFMGTDSFSYQINDGNSASNIASVIIEVNPIVGGNNPPSAIDDVSYTISGTQVSGSAGSNDTEPDNDIVYYAQLTNPSNGMINFYMDGTYTYIPYTGYSGPDEFTYEVCDNSVPNNCDKATVHILVGIANTHPKAFNDINTTIVDVSTDGNLLTNDIDKDGDQLIATTNPLAGPFNGTISIQANGEYDYVPNTGYFGVDSLLYEVCDDKAGLILCDTGIATIIIVDCFTPGNGAPIGQDDNFVGLKDVPIQTNLFRNDYDKDKDNVTLNIPSLSGPTNGVLSAFLNGDFIYTPNVGYSGVDSFVYEICDDTSPSQCTSATVLISIEQDTGENQSPFAGDDATHCFRNQSVSFNLLVNDFDIDGDSIIFSTPLLTQPEFGSVSITSSGEITYTPIAEYIGPDNFIYEICDNVVPSTCTKATFYVIVKPKNDPPTTMHDDNITIVNSSVNGNVLVNDSDPDTNTLIFDPASASNPTNGSLIISANGEYTYTPNQGFTGRDSFQYEVCDDGVPGPYCKTATVNIIVSAITLAANNIPIANNDDNLTYVNTSLSGQVQSNDRDPDNDALTVSTIPVALPANGAVVININGSYSYTPNLDFDGNDQFSYEVCDDGNPVLCDQATVFITILPIPISENNPPFAGDDFNIIQENTPITDNLISNDNDTDGDNLSVTSTPIVQPENGVLQLTSTGNYYYNPNIGYTGTDQFVYQICDDGSPIICSEATVYLLVVPTIQPIVTINDFNMTFENLSVSGKVATNDINPNGNELTVTGFSATSGGPYTNTLSLPGEGIFSLDDSTGTYTFVPISSFSGTTSPIKYQICDSLYHICKTAELTIEVITTSFNNDPPIANIDHFQTMVNQPVNGNSFANDYDPEEDSPLVFKKMSSPQKGILGFNLDGSFVYTPQNSYAGTDNFIYQVCDPDGLCKDATVFITITPSRGTNMPPAAVDDGYATSMEKLISNDVTLNDPDDPDNDQTRVSSINGSLIPDGGSLTGTTMYGGSVTMNSSGTFEYLPATNFFGTDQFVYKVCDNISGCDQATVYIIVYNLNKSPVAVNDDNITFIDNPVTGRMLTNDFDLDGDVLTSNTSPVLNPTNGTVTIYSDGKYDYTPNIGFVGKDEFTYEICDDNIKPICVSAKVTINVIRGKEDLTSNDPPIANNDDNITYVNKYVEGNVLPNDFDPENTDLTISGIVAQPLNGLASTLPTGEYIYYPSPGFIGIDQFTYLMCDSGVPLECVTAIVFIEVIPRPENDTNYPPVATDDFNYTPYSIPCSGKVIMNDCDPDNDQILVKTAEGTPIVQGGTIINTENGTVVIYPNGDYNYSPTTGFNGTDQFKYEICDDISGCSKATVYIFVEELDCIEIQLKVLLEGALYDLNSNNTYLQQMRTDLNNLRSVLPGQTPLNPLISPTPPGQPYDIAPFDYQGTDVENNFAGPYAPDIVDWVLISLRTDITPETEFRQAAGLLHSDGRVSFMEPCILKSTDPEQIYILVEHRNHMGIMTPVPVTMINGSILWDFTAENSYVGAAGFGSKQVLTGVFVMYTGDNNQLLDSPSYDINGLDKLLWTEENGNFDQYLLSDLNMNGDVNGSDKILWSINNGFASRVKK